MRNSGDIKGIKRNFSREFQLLPAECMKLTNVHYFRWMFFIPNFSRYKGYSVIKISELLPYQFTRFFFQNLERLTKGGIFYKAKLLLLHFYSKFLFFETERTHCKHTDSDKQQKNVIFRKRACCLATVDGHL